MKTKLLGVLVEPSIYERLRVRAFEERVNISELIRRAVSEYLGKKDGGRRHGRA